MQNLNSKELRTIKQFCEERLAFTPAGMRWFIFQEDLNGLRESGAIVRVGSGKKRRILIHVSSFDKWLLQQQDKD